MKALKVYGLKKISENKSSSLVIVDPFFIDDKTTDMKNDTEKYFTQTLIS